MKRALVAGLMLLLAGCATLQPNLIVNKRVVLQPPGELTTCKVEELPQKFKSNKEVAQFMLRTYDNNVVCKLHMDGIVRYYRDAEKDVQ
jgi:hypothetical protein